MIATRHGGRATEPRLGVPADASCAGLLAGLEVSERPAAELAGALARGEVDIALLPAHVLAREAERYDIVPGLAVGSDGACAFARLEMAGAAEDVRRIASAAPGHAAEALSVLLFLAAGRRVEIVGAAEPADALLVAGDAALAAPAPAGRRALDLGAEWTALTGLPFLWYLWASRPGHCDRKTYGRLHDARTRGRAVARAVHRLGRRQLAGLRRFGDELARHGLLPSPPAWRFVPFAAGTVCRDRGVRE